jgi:hypothetical protein
MLPTFVRRKLELKTSPIHEADFLAQRRRARREEQRNAEFIIVASKNAGGSNFGMAPVVRVKHSEQNFAREFKNAA